MAESARRISFNRRYTPRRFDEHVFHPHPRVRGDNDEIYLRDYLTAHPDTAYAYEQLKLSLWKQYELSRDRYTESKTAFVRKYTLRAKEENRTREA